MIPNPHDPLPYLRQIVDEFYAALAAGNVEESMELANYLDGVWTQVKYSDAFVPGPQLRKARRFMDTKRVAAIREADNALHNLWRLERLVEEAPRVGDDAWAVRRFWRQYDNHVAAVEVYMPPAVGRIVKARLSDIKRQTAAARKQYELDAEYARTMEGIKDLQAYADSRRPHMGDGALSAVDDRLAKMKKRVVKLKAEGAKLPRPRKKVAKKKGRKKKAAKKKATRRRRANPIHSYMRSL